MYMTSYFKLSKGPRILKNQFPKSGNELTQFLKVLGIDLEIAVLVYIYGSMGEDWRLLF